MREEEDLLTAVEVDGESVPSAVVHEQARCQGEDGCFADLAPASVGLACRAAARLTAWGTVLTNPRHTCRGIGSTG